MEYEFTCPNCGGKVSVQGLLPVGFDPEEFCCGVEEKDGTSTEPVVIGFISDSTPEIELTPIAVVEEKVVEVKPQAKSAPQAKAKPKVASNEPAED